MFSAGLAFVLLEAVHSIRAIRAVVGLSFYFFSCAVLSQNAVALLQSICTEFVIF